MPSHWEKIRKDFPVTRRIYLDHAAGGPVPSPVRRRMEEYLRENELEGDFAWPKWMKRLELAREQAARFIHAEPDEIAFTHSTSHGMSCIADLLAHEGGVLTNTSEFPSSTLPWIWKKARMIFQEPEQGKISLEKLKSLLSPSVATILTSYVQYATGFRQDLASLGKIKGRRFLVVNATQGFGALPVNVKEWKADFLCTNSYKWLMAGYGGGILYIRKKWLSRFRPGSVGWRSVVFPEAMDNRKIRLSKRAARYEPGCPSFGTVFAVGAAIEYLSSIGMEAIFRRILELTDYAITRLEENGFEIASPKEEKHRSGILIIRMAKAEAVWKRLLGFDIFVTARGEGIRLAPHFYNSFGEIDFFVEKLKQCRNAQTRLRTKTGGRHVE